MLSFFMCFKIGVGVASLVYKSVKLGFKKIWNMYRCVLHKVKECVIRVQLREINYLLYVLHVPYVNPQIFFMSYNIITVFLVCFQNSISPHTLHFVFYFISHCSSIYNYYVLFICTCFYVYKYLYSWAYCPMYKEINC